MRLICIRADKVDALVQLRIPFEHVTPNGLWDTGYHLVGIAAEQRDVLTSWKVDLEDITGSALSSALQGGAPAPGTGQPRSAATQVRTRQEKGNAASDVAVPLASSTDASSEEGADQPVQISIERRARLRMSGAGRIVEGTYEGGKIVVGNKSYDSPQQAAADMAPDKAKFAFWEFYDDTDGKWRILDRDWERLLEQPQAGA